jgi:hypothetical protein
VQQQRRVCGFGGHMVYATIQGSFRGLDPRAARGVASIRRAVGLARRRIMKTLRAVVERDSFGVPAFGGN